LRIGMVDAIHVGLALILFSIGFQADFEQALHTLVPGTTDFYAYAGTLASNLLLLPAYAIGTLHALGDVPAPSALGVCLAALAPGGPLANIAAVGLGANSELNIVLTASEQAACVGLIPLGVLVVMPAALPSSRGLSVPYEELSASVVGLVLPLLVGVLAGSALERASQRRGGGSSRALRQWLTALGFLSGVGVIGLVGAATTGLLSVPWLARALAAPAADSLATGLQQLRLEISRGGVELLRRLMPPESARAVGLVCAGFLAWGALLGVLLPHQPRANAVSVFLEVCMRDVGILMPLVILGLPASMPLLERAAVLLSAISVAAGCNLGSLGCLTCCAAMRRRARARSAQGEVDERGLKTLL
jgi:hypothetical protein